MQALHSPRIPLGSPYEPISGLCTGTHLVTPYLILFLIRGEDLDCTLKVLELRIEGLGFKV